MKIIHLIIKTIGLIIVPQAIWYTLTAFGYGAQSLSNLIEIPIILLVSIISALQIKKINYPYLIGFMILFSFLLRTFMPLIPE